MDVNIKTCSTCKTPKPTTEFSKNKRQKDGLQTKCKCCAKAYARDNAEAIKAYAAKRYQENAEAIKAYAARYHQDNAEARNAYCAKYRRDNPEAIKAYAARRRDSLTVVESVARGSVTGARTRSSLSSEDLYGGLSFTQACAITLPFVEERLRLEQETGEKYHIDHKIPISAGGTHTADNLQVLTKLENLLKGSQDKILIKQYRDN